MSKKGQLRTQREGTIINVTSKIQEMDCNTVITKLIQDLEDEFSVKLSHKKSIYLKDIVSFLRNEYPEDDFHYYFKTSSMKPDGGILSLTCKDGNEYPILITEVKNQGTNDLRAKEGKKKQAKGNAIERLGKNVIGFRTFLLHESIFPFVCFGYGCDFADDSSILDRVVTIAEFGHLNTTYLHNEGKLNRGSFYFRQEKWTNEEVYEIAYDIAKKSLYYYFSKYGEEKFIK